jgi:hypothetical protein
MRNYLADVFRGLAAAGVLLSAVVHLDQYEAGFRDVATIGPLFLVNAAGGLVIGIAMLVWRHWFPALLAAGFGAVTVIAYWISVVHGLFGVKESTGGWAVVLAEASEYAAIVFGLTATVLLGPWRPRRRARTSVQPTEPLRTTLLR